MTDPLAHHDPKQRLTLRQYGSTAHGTCGDCNHLVDHLFGGPGRWQICTIGPTTSSKHTDVRDFWPACERFNRTPHATLPEETATALGADQ